MTKAIEGRTEEEKLLLTRDTVDYLNELLNIDRKAIRRLVSHHVPCSLELVEHPTVQAHATHVAQPEYAVGMLGIINGLIGVRNHTGYITAVFGAETGELLRFEFTRRRGERTPEEILKEHDDAQKSEPPPGEGWGWPPSAKKMHYFGPDHRALCLKWAYTGERLNGEPGRENKEVCKVCFDRHAGKR